MSWRQADDAIIADNFFQGHLNIFLPEISWNGPGPNYVGYEFQITTYIAALLYYIFGQVDWIGRGISVVFGVWSVYAFYNLVRRAFNEVRALVSCAVLAVMPNGIFVDRSFLPDPVMVSLVVTSVWMFLAYLQDRRVRYLGWGTTIGTLGLLTKISGLIVGIPVLYIIACARQCLVEVLVLSDDSLNPDAHSCNRILRLGAACFAYLSPLPCGSPWRPFRAGQIQCRSVQRPGPLELP